MSILKPLDVKFPIERQLGVKAESAVLVNVFTLDATGSSDFFLSKGQRQGPVGNKLKRLPFMRLFDLAWHGD